MVPLRYTGNRLELESHRAQFKEGRRTPGGPAGHLASVELAALAADFPLTPLF